MKDPRRSQSHTQMISVCARCFQMKDGVDIVIRKKRSKKHLTMSLEQVNTLEFSDKVPVLHENGYSPMRRAVARYPSHSQSRNYENATLQF